MSEARNSPERKISVFPLTCHKQHLLSEARTSPEHESFNIPFALSQKTPPEHENLIISFDLSQKTLPKIKFEGRVQFIKGKLSKNLKKTKILVDGCHSDESTKNLARYLKKFKIPVYGICGMLKNNNPNQLIKNFKGIL